MPEMTGIELHQRLIEIGHVIPTIFISAYPASVRDGLEGENVVCRLRKPFDDNELQLCVREALRRDRPLAADS